MIISRQTRPAIGADDAAFSVQRIHDLLRRFVRSRDEDMLAPRRYQSFGALRERRIAIVIAFGEATRFHAVRRQQCRMRQQ